MTRLSLFLVVSLIVSVIPATAQLSYLGVRSPVLEHDSRLDDLYQIDKVGSDNENPYE